MDYNYARETKSHVAELDSGRENVIKESDIFRIIHGLQLFQPCAGDVRRTSLG